MKFWVFFSLLISFIAFSCQKEPTAPPASKTLMPVSQAIKDWGHFKKGSYWIYRDSVTSTVDSVYVTSVSLGTQTTTSHLVDYITISFSDPDFDYTLCSWPFDRLEHRSTFNAVVFNPSATNTTSTYGGGINANYSVDSLLVAGTYSYNLQHLFYSYQFANPSVWEVERCYWKKHIGRVKKCPHPSTPFTSLYHAYELIRYNVVQ